MPLKHGDSEQAIASFKEALRHEPALWEIDTFEDCLADAYVELNRLDEAIAEYQRVLLLNPRYPLARFRLAQVYEKKGLLPQARAEYERFLALWKDADRDIPQVRLAEAHSAHLAVLSAVQWQDRALAQATGERPFSISR